MAVQDTNPRVASCVLATLGELATVGGEDMTPHLPQLLPLIIDTLQDQSSVVKREVALRTLGQLAESSGTRLFPPPPTIGVKTTAIGVKNHRSHDLLQAM